MSVIYIGLGSNISPEENLRAAAQMLRDEFSDATFSSVYRSAAMLKEDQADFLNAVAKVETDESPTGVFEKLQSIEKKLKKDPPERYWPRTIDLDLLLCNEASIDEENLKIPHPRMHERRFVLEPLCELIDPNSTHPTINERFRDLLKTVEEQDCERIDLVL